MVYAGDVAEGVARALEREAAGGRAYNLVGGGTSWEFSEAWKRAGGRAPRLRIPVPLPGMRRYSHERARGELDWSPRPLVDALRETFALDAGD